MCLIALSSTSNYLRYFVSYVLDHSCRATSTQMSYATLAMDAPAASNTRQELQLEQVVSQIGEVKIVHPGFNLPFLSFPTLDPDPSGLPRYGIAYLLAVNGCHVLTNGLAGYIVTDTQGKAPVSCEDNFLATGRYFYFVGSHDAPKSDRH